MRDVLLSALVLACPVGMGLMMWFMSRGMRGARTPERAPTEASLAELRAEHRRLGAELERAELRNPPA